MMKARLLVLGHGGLTYRCDRSDDCLGNLTSIFHRHNLALDAARDRNKDAVSKAFKVVVRDYHFHIVPTEQEVP